MATEQNSAEAPADRVRPRAAVTDGATSADVLRLFAITWAMVTLFHVWVNPRSIGVFESPGALGISHVALTLVALWVLRRPGSLPALTIMCALQVVSAWLEMPVLGNHWLLVALVASGFLITIATGRESVPARFLPVARVTLLVAYGCAAFSKLNEGFFTPPRSCGTFYARELLTAWGLPALPDHEPLAWLIIVGSVATECSIPVLLFFRRTRHIGVLTGLVFHSMIALDIKHLFTDFSCVLLALFLLFLPPSFVPWVRDRVPRWKFWSWILIAMAVLVSVLFWRTPDGTEKAPGIQALGFLLWVVFDLVVLVLVIGYLRRVRPRAEPGMLRIAPSWLVVVPVLALLNGLTPYLELKTAFGWNMYSNLVTVDGRSNHLLVRRTLPLTDGNRRLVTVLESSDPDLLSYATTGYRIPLQQLREYADRRPGSSLRYELDGAVHEAPRIGSDPVLSRDLPLWRTKLQVFRAVDTQDPPRCLDGWGAAR